jgi:hypothetical protein
MTTLANVTCKVRVNGGSATTYTNVSSPAITQNTDCTFGYELQIPASTYADGDVVEHAWLYSDTAYAYGTDVIGSALFAAGALGTYTGPVAATGTVNLIAGDDYKTTDTRALTWTVTGTPSLSGATIRLKIGSLTITGSASGTTVSVELTAANTTTLLGSSSRAGGTYQLVATLSNADIVTLANGPWFVQTPTG